VERILLDTMPNRIKATVLKIAHHGSETSSTEQFINAVDPELSSFQAAGRASTAPSCR
jgi:competence protein ComEC